MEQKTINHLKALVINSVHQANSGHPGGALSAMDFTYTLFSQFLRFDPDNSNWLGRDRFILSAGHMSMLHYSMLHGIGWLDEKDLRNFRQLHSRTPGHPEFSETPGVECTTGPLGQGAAMSLGFAIASSHLQAKLDQKLFSTRTWALLGDGCMQEDITLSAASLAGHLGLGQLIWYYDKNKCQIAGSTERVTSDDEEKIFTGFGWKVIKVDAHDRKAIRDILTKVYSTTYKQPLLIIGNSVMAQGSASMEGLPSTHGAPLPPEEREKTLEALGVPTKEFFALPDNIKKHFQQNFGQRRHEAHRWQKSLEDKLQCDKSFLQNYNNYFKHEPASFVKDHNFAWELKKPYATRVCFGNLLEDWAHRIPSLIGGSADLDPSNMTEAFAKKVQDYSAARPEGRNIAFGVREFLMSAISNGLCLYGGLLPFDATFLAFSDYSRPALRLGALQKLRVLHEFTHDSFYLGEDGPTHQPVEHLASLRAMPGMYVIRPCDARETETLMKHSLTLKAPSSFCLSRQKLPHLALPEQNYQNATRGAWVVQQQLETFDFILFASGSEVFLALELAQLLKEKHSQNSRVVSVACWELFFEQEKSYIDKIMAPHCKRRVSIEAASSFGWERFVGMDGLKIGIDSFGLSAPAKDLAQHFGFTPQNILNTLLKKYELF